METTITDFTDDVRFDELDEDIKKFEQEPKIREALMKGLEMREYSRNIASQLQEVERDSVQDYINESDNLAGLHEQILSCDNILQEMESTLSGFQADLGSLSSEIKHLQDESFSMNIKLKNRKSVENNMGGFLEGVILDPELVRNINEGQINDTYLHYLTILNRKLAFIEAHEDRHSKACADVKPELENLRMKAVHKIRDFLMNAIGQLKKPRMNIQTQQQTVLLKYKYFFQFLLEHGQMVAAEIREFYADTVSKIYQSYFEWYQKSIFKLKIEYGSRSELLGAVDSQPKGGLFPSKTRQTKGSVFALGDRAEILDREEEPSIVYNTAVAANMTFSIESLFRSVNYLLLDTAASEFLFCVSFFGRMDIFDTVMQRTLSVLVEFMKDMLDTMYDAIGILIIIRVVRQHQFIMQKRKIPALDNYFDQLVALLWPRFKAVFDLNANSLKTATSRQLWGDTISVLPTNVCRRYSDFAAAIHALAINEMLERNLMALRQEFEQVLLRMAADFGDPKLHIIFLINNYDVILSIFNEHGRSESSDAVFFRQQLQTQVPAFVEEVLTEQYADLITVVKDLESKVCESSSNEEIEALVNPELIESLVQKFGEKWKQGIEHINSSVMEFFPNFENGVEILKQVFSQLLLYYTRFLDIVKKRWRKPPFERDMIAIPTLLYEIKKYSKLF